MIALNLPAFGYKFKKVNGKLCIYDVLRRQYVVLYPEEWVRQHLVHYMITHLHYPRTLIQIESSLKTVEKTGRADLIIHDRTGQPWMVIECKSPEVKVSSATLYQASKYNNELKAPFLVVTNGLDLYAYSINHITQTIEALDSWPGFPEALTGIS